MQKMSDGVPIALTIAGSDSGGGAGIQADIKVFSALGAYATSVITAVTAQNTRGVAGSHVLAADFVSLQMRSLASDMSIDAVKLGMLANKNIIAAVAEGIREHGWTPVVVDPVMVAQSGDKLLESDATNALRELLFPLATVITPNIPEAALLLARDEKEITREPRQAAASLMEFGARAVLLKGGHGKGRYATDWLVTREHQEALTRPRIDTRNTHGTGCSLSAAICTMLAHKLELRDAVSRAKDYISSALEAGRSLSIGRGNGPVHHFYKQWEEGK